MKKAVFLLIMGMIFLGIFCPNSLAKKFIPEINGNIILLKEKEITTKLKLIVSDGISQITLGRIIKEWAQEKKENFIYNNGYIISTVMPFKLESKGIYKIHYNKEKQLINVSQKKVLKNTGLEKKYKKYFYKYLFVILFIFFLSNISGCCLVSGKKKIFIVLILSAVIAAAMGAATGAVADENAFSGTMVVILSSFIASAGITEIIGLYKKKPSSTGTSSNAFAIIIAIIGAFIATSTGVYAIKNAILGVKINDFIYCQIISGYFILFFTQLCAIYIYLKNK